tara:strand:+ start:168 stop:1268 length:1101 start_codon:yes stop_codon:yes gene_type:complete
MNWNLQLHKLQVDMTSHCNARCGACIRNVDGGETRQGLLLTHFDLDLWKRIASKDTKGWWIRELTLNGNWGDPMMHPHLVEMLEYWTNCHPETFITIATNGSMRGPQFWADLAKVLRNGCQHKVDFAIDGMEDTHHLYRRRTIFSKIVENVKSFASAGGAATIQMTMFEHNKHQIEDVKELSRTMGAKQFVARRSFTGDNIVTIKDVDEEYTIKGYYPSGKADFNGLDNSELSQQFPENENPVSDLKDADVYLEANLRFGEMEIFYEKSKCPWHQQGEVQIDPWGTVWPCCHISLYGGGEASSYMSVTKDFNEEAEHLINDGKKENNLHNDSLQNILNNEWFNERVDKAVKNADWKICRNTCGVCK